MKPRAPRPEAESLRLRSHQCGNTSFHCESEGGFTYHTEPNPTTPAIVGMIYQLKLLCIINPKASRTQHLSHASCRLSYNHYIKQRLPNFHTPTPNAACTIDPLLYANLIRLSTHHNRDPGLAIHRTGHCWAHLTIPHLTSVGAPSRTRPIVSW